MQELRYIKPTQLFSGKKFLDNAPILVLNTKGVVVDFLNTSSIESSRVEVVEGIICPGFVNTHCHLELSHLKNKINTHTGIVNFGLEVIKQRNNLAPEAQQELMFEADKEMRNNGIVAVGDISNSFLSSTTKKKSSLYYHTFVELISLNPERADLVVNEGKKLIEEFERLYLSASLAPHAPYSASQKLIQVISNYCAEVKQPTSIHNQESDTENNFFKTKTGNYVTLYDTLKLSIDFFKPTNQTSLLSILSAFNTKVKTLLVHNTFTNADDIEKALNHFEEPYWCLCPNANLYIEKKLPNIDLLLQKKCVLTIGTDSLASNTTLSVIDEINTILKQNPTIPLNTLLQSATYNGAKFLGIENTFGLLEKGKQPGINLIQGAAGNFKCSVL